MSVRGLLASTGKRTIGGLMMLLESCFWPTVGPGQPLETSRALTQYVLQNWQQEHGLPQNSITAIVQTRDGYLWLGTYQGLVRFDGVTFTTYTTRTTPELGSNGIWSLCETPDGTLWIGTNGGGLVRYDGRTFRRLTTEDGLGHNTVLSLGLTSSGDLYAGTIEGYSVLRGEAPLPLEQHPELQSTTVYAVAEISPGEIWFGTRQGLFVQDPNGQLRTQALLSPQKETPIVTTLRKDRSGNVWVGTRAHGLFRYRSDQMEAVSASLGLVGKTINKVYEDPVGTLWIGTFGGGLQRLRNGKVERLGADHGLADDDVLSILYDREGSLWFGTKRGGLQRLKNSKVVNYGIPEGLPSDNISCFYPSQSGGIWVGSSQGGIARINPEILQAEVPPALKPFSDRYIRSLYEDDSGGLWFAIYGTGVGYYSNGRVRLYDTRDGVSDIFVRSILPGPDGSVWLGTRLGVNSFQGGSFRRVVDPAEPEAPPVLAMTHGASGLGDLWIGTDGQGLLHYREGIFRRFGLQDSLLSTVVLALYYEPNTQALWVGTNSGLNLWHGERMYRLLDLDPVFSEAILQIEADAFGNLWLGTSHGVYQVSHSVLLSAAAGNKDSPKSVIPIRYDQSDGMRSAECVAATEPGIGTTKDGRVWIATIRGLTAVDPTHIARNEVPPPVSIERLIVDGNALSPVEGIAIAPGAKVVEIQYTGLSFLVPSKVRFKYRLQGFSETWIDAGARRSAFFTGLPPGRYTFEVLAENNDGVWSTQVSRISFWLEPHFYQTHWFFLLVFLGIGMGVAGAIRLRIRRNLRERRRLEQRVAERTAEVEEQKRKLTQRNQELARANSNLSSKSEALQQALVSLQRAQDQLVASEKMAVLGQLVANIAHEINSPISAITASARHASRQLPGLVEELATRLRTLSSSEVAAFLALIQRASQPLAPMSTREERAIRAHLEVALDKLGTASPVDCAYTLAQMGIADELRPFSALLVRPDTVALLELTANLASVLRSSETSQQAAQKTGKIVQALKTYAHQERMARREPAQLSESIETILTIYSSQLRRGIEVVRQYAPLPDVEVFLDEIEQVWTNLLSNALMAMGGEGVLTITLETDGKWAIVSFSDTGVGIATEALPHIFEPFFTTRPKGQGSGLGLDICRKIVEKHNGTISVRSQPGNTVFTIRLPLIAQG